MISSKYASSIAAASGGHAHPPIPTHPCLTPSDLPRNHLLETSQVPLHTVVWDPRLQPENQHHLDNRLKNKPDVIGSSPSRIRILVVRVQLL